jgi:hypothetical protein
MKWSASSLLLLAISTLLMSCSPKTLTRGKAKDVIENRPAEATTIWLTDEELSAGLQKGLWVKSTNNFGSQYYQMTPLVKDCLRFQDQYHGTVFPATKFKTKVVEVTGISDAGSEFGPSGTVKIVDFTYLWDFAGCPDVVREVVTKPVEHKSLLKLYDDGWRLEQWN